MTSWKKEFITSFFLVVSNVAHVLRYLTPFVLLNLSQSTISQRHPNTLLYSTHHMSDLCRHSAPSPFTNFSTKFHGSFSFLTLGTFPLFHGITQYFITIISVSLAPGHSARWMINATYSPRQVTVGTVVNTGKLWKMQYCSTAGQYRVYHSYWCIAYKMRCAMSNVSFVECKSLKWKKLRLLNHYLGTQLLISPPHVHYRKREWRPKFHFRISSHNFAKQCQSWI